MRNNLKKYFNTVLNYDAAEEMTQLVLKSDEAIRLEYALPNIVSYVWWLLSDAISKKIEVLYFVSREGYILKEIAEIFVKKFSLAITCRYLYCSSRAVKLSAYHLMDDEKYKQIFKGGYGVSPFVILDRVLLSDRERKQIYNDICFDMANEHTHFSKSGRIRFATRLRHNKLFRDMVIEKSRATYENTFGYLEQEGLLDKTKSQALVWLGFDNITQKTIARLFKNDKQSQALKGYYFGLYDAGNNAHSGVNYTFYFNQGTNAITKAKLNVNLLFAMCRAPHTEVMGYAQKQGEFLPIFLKKEDEEESAYSEVEGLHKALLEMVDKLTDMARFNSIKRRRVVAELKRLNNQIMYMPDEKQADEFRKLCFYNGKSEANGTPLVALLERDEMLQYGFRRRFKNKKRDVSDEETKRFLFWGYGSLAITPNMKSRLWVRWSLLAWDVIGLAVKHK